MPFSHGCRDVWRLSIKPDSGADDHAGVLVAESSFWRSELLTPVARLGPQAILAAFDRIVSNLGHPTTVHLERGGDWVALTLELQRRGVEIVRPFAPIPATA